jgi:phosphoglucosamine mutase
MPRRLLAESGVKQAIAAAEVRLGDGRVFVRNSGTEPLIRVMVDGDDSSLLRKVVDQIIEALPQDSA